MGWPRSLRIRADDRCLELVVLARERVEVAVESADADDAGELGRCVVVVEHQIATRREVPEVARDGIMCVRGAFGGQPVRERRGLLDAVVVAEPERQRKLGGELARGGVVVEPRDELGVAEGDAELRRIRGVAGRRGIVVPRRRLRLRLRLGGGSASSSPQADSATAAKMASAAIRRGITWSSRSAGGVAAVDGQGDADDEARAGAAQPQDGGGDLVGATEPADRLACARRPPSRSARRWRSCPRPSACRSCLGRPR